MCPIGIKEKLYTHVVNKQTALSGSQFRPPALPEVKVIKGGFTVSFYRFEDYEGKSLAPQLDPQGAGRVVEGKYMYFCKISNEAGQGSELHYHPNELLIFTLEGKINVLMGKDRRIISPGTFIHVPPLARHQVKATEDGPMSYLYIKDQTWTVVGIAADEALPDQAPDLEEEAEKVRRGEMSKQEKDKGKSTARTEELGNCYYPILTTLDDSPSSGSRIYRVDGERMGFEFNERSKGFRDASHVSAHEKFYYVLSGSIDAQVGNHKKRIGAGDIMYVPKGSHYSLLILEGPVARYISVSSKKNLESMGSQK